MALHRALFIATLTLLVSALAALSPAQAHHSYALFDGSKTLTVAGTVAKLEWVNPHTFLWIYVRNPDAVGGYDLYAFENGSPAVLAQRGWSKGMFEIGETVSVEYWPLRDGRLGGHLHSVMRADGTVSRGVGGPRGADGDLETDASAAAKQRQ